MPAPQGEAYDKGRNFKFMRFATIRYKTGEARPPKGRLYQSQKIEIDLYRLLTQTLSPKGKARERICVTVNIFR